MAPRSSLPPADPPQQMAPRQEQIARSIAVVTILNALVSEADLLGAADDARALEEARVQIGSALDDVPDFDGSTWRKDVGVARDRVIETMRADLDSPVDLPR